MNETGRYDEAISYFEQVLNIDPDNDEANDGISFAQNVSETLSLRY